MDRAAYIYRKGVEIGLAPIGGLERLFGSYAYSPLATVDAGGRRDWIYTAATFGHRVALVEKEAQIGGAGINSGTVPSKTLRETALALSGWHSRKLFGVDPKNP